MSFDSHHVNTGSKRYERLAFGIGGDDVVEAVNGRM